MDSKDMRKSFNENILGILNDGPYNAIMFFTSFYKDQIDELVRANRIGITGDNMYKLANPKFNRSQMRELITIMTNKNSNNKIIDASCNPELSSSKMHLVVLGLKNGLSYEQIMLYIGDAYSYNQMVEIYSGLVSRLSTNDVKRYCDSRLSPEVMHKIRLKLSSI